MHLKMLSAKSRPFHPDLKVLMASGGILLCIRIKRPGSVLGGGWFAVISLSRVSSIILIISRESNVWAFPLENYWVINHMHTSTLFEVYAWWRHQMETFFTLLALSAGNSPVTGGFPSALMFSLICAWTNGWVHIPDAGDLRRHRAHYAVTVMLWSLSKRSSWV